MFTRRIKHGSSSFHSCITSKWERQADRGGGRRGAGGRPSPNTSMRMKPPSRSAHQRSLLRPTQRGRMWAVCSHRSSLVSPIRISLTLRRRLLLPNPRLPALWTQAEPLLARASRFSARGGRGRDGRANQELHTRRNRKEDQLAGSGGRRRWGQCEYVTGELMRRDGSLTLLLTR